MAVELDLAKADPVWKAYAEPYVQALAAAVLELEYTLIPHGMHVIGAPPEAQERVEMLIALGEVSHGKRPQQAGIEALVAGMPPEDVMSRGLGGDGCGRVSLR